ncbi:MAG: CCA tRNA nucleotidyltransferase [Thermoanaerobaculales bacterium]|jgi:poly(A) polymerase|nr:CCA tRNA nucleotidyltransferase [Thermoanaerobaculales bacterium]
MSSAAIKVLYRLHRSGYTSYLVGGAVRDLMLGGSPKDFDVATNARPQEIRKLFRNSRIIGRRFRLVHILFRGEIIEVATFRASSEAPEGPDDWEEAEAEAAEVEADPPRRPAPVEQARFGSPAEDAWRRDFTINGLFYNIADFSVIDHVGGLDDLQARVIRTIGEPERRFREDPVRMMRALEYGARLGFEIEPATRNAITECRDEISTASPARLAYELFETLRSGASAKIYSAWRSAGVFELAFPGVAGRPEEDVGILAEVDRAVARNVNPSDATLVGAFFLHPMYRAFGELTRDGRRLDNVEMLRRIAEMLEAASANLRLANHTNHLVQQGLFTLTKMHRPPERGRQVLKLARQDYFGVATGLHALAASAGLVPASVQQAWQKAARRVGKDGPKEKMETKPLRGRRRRRPRRRRRR